MTIGIYMIINTMNNKKYIGQSVNIKRRKSEHFTKHCNKMVISNAIFKHGKENFDFEILEECDESQLNELEIKYITEYKSNNREFGYNVDNGGNGTGKMSEETKQKIKKSTIGDKNHFYGKKHTDEVKKLISKLSSGKNNSFYGKKHTEERNQKLSIKNKKNDWNNRGKGVLYTKRYDRILTTNFNGKIKSVNISKYKDLSIPLIICTRICMENEIDFKSNLVKDIENFVQKFDLKTINIIN